MQIYLNRDTYSLIYEYVVSYTDDGSEFCRNMFAV